MQVLVYFCDSNYSLIFRDCVVLCWSVWFISCHWGSYWSLMMLVEGSEGTYQSQVALSL